MDVTLKDALIKQHGGLAAFAQSSSDGDFIWGLSDLFGYQGPADLSRLDVNAKQLMVLSFFCKEYLQGGFASVVENLPEHSPEIGAGLRRYAPERLADEFQQILARARDEGIDLSDDEARWAYIEDSRDFRAVSADCQHYFRDLISSLRDAVKVLR